MKQQLIQSIKIIALALILGAGVTLLYAWQDPSTLGNTVLPPLDVSSDSQEKEDVLGVHGLAVFGDAFLENRVGIDIDPTTITEKLFVNEGNVRVTVDPAQVGYAYAITGQIQSGQQTPQCPCDTDPSGNSGCGSSFTTLTSVGNTCFDWAEDPSFNPSQFSWEYELQNPNNPLTVTGGKGYFYNLTVGDSSLPSTHKPSFVLSPSIAGSAFNIINDGGVLKYLNDSLQEIFSIAQSGDVTVDNLSHGFSTPQKTCTDTSGAFVECPTATAIPYTSIGVLPTWGPIMIQKPGPGSGLSIPENIILASGTEFTVFWDAINADECGMTIVRVLPDDTTFPWFSASSFPGSHVVSGPDGTYTSTIVCIADGGYNWDSIIVELGQPSLLPAATITLSQTPPGPLVAPADYSVDWSVTTPMQGVWTLPACTFSGDWSLNPINIISLPPGGSVPFNNMPFNMNMPFSTPLGSYTYTLTCTTIQGDVVSETLTVEMLSAPVWISFLSAIPATALSAPADYTIAWSAFGNGVTCDKSGDWSGTGLPAADNESFTNIGAGAYTHTITCADVDGNSATESVTMDIAVPTAPPAVSIDATLKQSFIEVSWNSVYADSMSCAMSGDLSYSPLSNSGGGFTDTDLSPGAKSYTITCSNSQGSSSDTATLTVPSLSDPPAISFISNTTQIISGVPSPLTLDWDVYNATACSAIGDWSGSKSNTMGTEVIGGLAGGTYTYTLECSNANGTNQESITVNVSNAPWVSIEATPSATLVSPANFTLTWDSAGADSCSVSSTGWGWGDGWSGSTLMSGLENFTNIISVTPSTRTYMISCTNGSGTSWESVGVTVVPAPLSVSISAAPPGPFVAPADFTISWDSTSATSCTVSAPGLSSTALTGSHAVTGGVPGTGPGNWIYSITCTGLDINLNPISSSDSVTVQVASPTPPPDVSIEANPIGYLPYPSNHVVIWDSTNADSCSVSVSLPWYQGNGGSDEFSGSKGFFSTSGTHTYDITCTNAGGSTSDSVTIP